MSNSVNGAENTPDRLLPVLVATTLTQGQRGNDFHAATEGELVQFAECDTDRGNPDGRCGCARAFCGLDSRKGTTTAVIAHRELSREDYLGHLRDSLRRAGIPDIDDELEEALASEADELLGFAEEWPVGTVLENRGNAVQVRDSSRS